MSVLDNLDIESCFDIQRLKAIIAALQKENSEYRMRLGIERRNGDKKLRAIEVINDNPGLSQVKLAKLAGCSKFLIYTIQKQMGVKHDTSN